ncbi:MAG: Lrp/AsnC family transcriptional regulator [Candidatus Woesearchaeota archaeon]
MKQYGLDLTDRKILYQLDLNSRISYKQLGKKLRIAKETVAFRVKRLKKQGYIKNFLTSIHVSNINRFYYKLFYKFHKTTPEIDKKIVNYIKNYRSIAYFSSLEGRYDIVFLILSKDMQDLYKFLVPFREKFGDYILEQEILTLTSTHRFNFRFFYEGGQLLHTQYAEKLTQPDTDELDFNIVRALAQNSRIKLIDIAKQNNTDTNVIKYRIKKLKKANILGTHVLEVDFEKFNQQQIQICYSLKNHAAIKRLIDYTAQIPKSTFATIMLGKYDLAVEFVVENMKELRQIMNKIKTQFSQEITDHETFIMEEHSINWFPIQQ